jgi:hypothetical protein
MKKEPLKTREQIITSMCHTWRHDYGLVKDDDSPITSGMTLEERKALWDRMAQVFDNDIIPAMKFRKKKDPKLDGLSKDLKRELGFSRVGNNAMRRGR